MPDKYVFIKTLEKPIDRSGKPYYKITDQDSVVWNLFRYEGKIELNKAYLFTYEINDQGYSNISKVTPLVNIFHQKALKEVANKNDIWRQCSMVFSYSKDLVNGGQIKIEDIFTYSDKIYDYLQEKTDKIYGGEKPDER